MNLGKNIYKNNVHEKHVQTKNVQYVKIEKYP